MSEHPFELTARLNARIANQRKELSHKEFVISRMRREAAETLTAIDGLLFLALTGPKGEHIAAIEAAQGIATAALDAAQGTEARRAETLGPVHDGPVGETDAPKIDYSGSQGG